MNLIAISASGCLVKRKEAISLVSRLGANGRSDTVIVDRDAIEREKTGGSVYDLAAKIELVPLSQWFKEGLNEDGVIDSHRIRDDAKAIPAEKIVVIDASACRFEQIAAMLEHARQSWYPLDDWHPAFGVICEDAHLLKVASALSDTFYCQPQLMSGKEVSKIVKTLENNARVYRWLGTKAGKFQHNINRIVSLLWRSHEKRKQKEKMK